MIINILILHLDFFFLQAKEIPGIKIFRSAATICFTNAELFLEAFQEKVCISVPIDG